MATCVSVPRFSKEFRQCRFMLRFSYQYCPQCGGECISDNTNDECDERAIITRYFRKGFEYERIVELLGKEHQIAMSIKTLKNRLREYNLKRRDLIWDEAHVRQEIAEVLNGPGCMGGYRSV